MEQRHGSENHQGFIRSSVRSKFFSQNEEMAFPQSFDNVSVQARGKRKKIPTNVVVGTCSRQNKRSNTETKDPLPVGSERERFFNAKGFNSPYSFEVHSGCFDTREYDDNVPSEPYVLRTPTTCVHCGAVKFYRETSGFCCLNGQVVLKTNGAPEELHMLFTSKSDECLNFRTMVRSYNCNFSMTSFGVHYDKDLCKNYNGIYTFRIQGQVYHFINEIIPLDNRPSHLQLYFFDTENEVQNRLNLSEWLVESLVTKVMKILENNPYTLFFRSLGTIYDLENRSIRIRCDPNIDQRTYSMPTVSQVAAIWVDHDDCADINMRHIVVHCKNGNNTRIQYYFGCYDPLQYPLLFPYGETGWHQGIERIDSKQKKTKTSTSEDILDATLFSSPEELIEKETIVMEKKKNRMHVSCREYYCYKLQIRSSTNSILLHSGRLLQQYVVDMYVKIETSRLDYFRHNQSVLRAELYQGIVDSLQNGQRIGHKIGRVIVLPRSFIGGPRDLRKRFMDAMALVQKYGKPDIFLTMTCNPNWPEIKEQLKYNDEAQNRPDLIARIFKSKLEELKEDILKKKIFGPIVAYIYVIEFQKRGLPHTHFLLILRKDSKITSPDLVDKFLCAEIPDEIKYPYLHSLVIRHMMHGPCGILNSKNVCMDSNSKCRFDYPKTFVESTHLDEKCYPQYKRPNNGKKVKVRNHFLDNRWIVPYSPYLLAKFNCHINVEICSSIQAVKYLYKYVYKGHDRIDFSVDDSDPDYVYDEIKMYQSARWVSPPEAMWRIFAFSLYDMSPSVVALQLHLENYQSVAFKEFDDLEKIVKRDYFQRSMLTEYFRMNISNVKAKIVLYRDFPEHFVWDSKSKMWYERKNKAFSIGRIVSVNIIEGERYYLRKLLNHVKGATSYENLKIVNGIHASTFREAALLHGLLNGDTDCELCLQEASQYQMPVTLRQLFATVLTLCDPHDPQKLWNSFKHHMIEDYIAKGLGTKKAELKALYEINEILQIYGKSINDYRLIEKFVNLEGINDLPKIITDELEIVVSNDDVLCEKKLNAEQRNAYNMIYHDVVNKNSGVYFIDGPGGTGKTFLYRSLLAAVRGKGMIALATASSGVAAGLLPGGRTAHSRFRIPLEVSAESACSISKQSSSAELFRMTQLIIWDEAPMLSRSAVESLDRMLQDVNENKLPFGGKVVVLGGDFRQVLPVVPRGQKEDIIDATFVNSYLWPIVKKIKLVENMRAKLDLPFCEYLLRIGNGTEPLHSCNLIKLEDEMVLHYDNEIESVSNLIDVVFPQLSNYTENIDNMINRVILSPKNESVDFINTIVMEQFPGDSFKYYSFDESLDVNEQAFDEDFLNTLTPNGIPPHELLLKLNCPIILLRNINPSEGLCNGTRLICKQFDRNVIYAEIAVGEYRSKKVFLPRIPFVPLQNDMAPFRFKRTQFPVRVCFAMTINKAQGQTLDFVGLYLPTPVFSHGQLYVALSRAKTRKCIKVLMKPYYENKKLHRQCTKNVVYKEILAAINSS